MYNVSGVMSGGREDLLGKSSQWTEESLARAGRKRAIQDELRNLYRLQGRHMQTSDLITVKVAAQKKLLQEAERQREELVSEAVRNLIFFRFTVFLTTFSRLDLTLRQIQLVQDYTQDNAKS